MADTLVRVFDSFDVADQARAALLSAGFNAEDVSMESTGDEAGPVQGNFALDLTEKETPMRGSANRQSNNSELRTVVHRNTCILQVAVENDRDGARAAGILDQYAGSDVAKSSDSHHKPMP
jgi:hypothetical protein